MPRLVKYIVIGVVILLAQLIIIDWIRIQNIKPDLMMLFIMYLGYREGRITGMLMGFGFGLLQDLSTASVFIGRAALSKAVVGLGAGSLKCKLIAVDPVVL